MTTRARRWVAGIGIGIGIPVLLIVLLAIFWNWNWFIPMLEGSTRSRDTSGVANESGTSLKPD